MLKAPQNDLAWLYLFPTILLGRLWPSDDDGDDDDGLVDENDREEKKNNDDNIR